MLARAPFDPSPFVLLSLILPRLAAILEPIIRMCQIQKETPDRTQAEHE